MPRVVFHPDSRTAEVPRGERLLTAAWKAGVGIKSVCGGRGKCGSCLVEVDAAATAADALTPLSDEEHALLPTDRQGHDTASHACATCAATSRSRCRGEPGGPQRPAKPYTVTRVAARPIVARVTAEIEPARMEAPSSLAERISRGVARAARVRKPALPVDGVAEFSLRSGVDTAREATATVQDALPGSHLRLLLQRPLLPVRRSYGGAAADMSEAVSIASLALGIHHQPARHAEPLRGFAPLQPGVSVLLRLAGGTAADLDLRLVSLAPENELRSSALFFIEHVLFQRDATHYRVLGISPGATQEQIKEHHRLLMSLFHPDRDTQLGETREHYATRANLAYNTLRDAGSRADYDTTLKPQAAPSTGAGCVGVRCAHHQPTKDGLGAFGRGSRRGRRSSRGGSVVA